MPIFLKVDVDLTSGKSISNLLVGEEIVRHIDLEGETFEVEDSTYDVTTVEVVPQPSRGRDIPPKLDEALAVLEQAYFDARPLVINIDGNTVDPIRSRLEGPERTLDVLLMSLFVNNEAVARMVNTAKMRLAKRELEDKRKADKPPSS